MADVTTELLSDEEPVVEEAAVEVPRKRRQASVRLFLSVPFVCADLSVQAGPEEHKRLKSDSSPADKVRQGPLSLATRS